MNARQFFLDPGGVDQNWLFVIIPAPTRVVYGHQYGGTDIRYGYVEGYLVPVFDKDKVVLSELRWIFETRLKGAGAHGLKWPPHLLARLRSAVKEIHFWQSKKEEASSPLEVDDSRFDQLDEAWIPVITLDGPGLLVWQNSD